MGKATDKAKGLGTEAAGAAKQIAGEIAGSSNLDAEGKAQRLKGKIQRNTADAEAIDEGDPKPADEAHNELG